MKLVSIHKLLFATLAFIAGYQNVRAQTWSLQQCIDTALVKNKSLQMGRNNIGLIGQKMQEAKANLIPKVHVNSDYKYYINLPYQLLPLSTFNAAAPDGQYKEAQFGVPHNIQASLQFSMPIYNAQIYGGIQSANIAKELQELQYQKTEEQVYFEISQLYYNAQILHQQLSFIDSNLTNSNRLLKNIQLLHENLLAKGADVYKVQLQTEQLKTQKESIYSKYIQILNALKFAMGISIQEQITIDPNIEFIAPKEYNISPLLDIRINKTQNKLILNEIKSLNQQMKSPIINLLGMYGTTGFGYDKRPNNFLKFYPIGFTGIQFSFPLFNGTVTQKKISQKQYELKNNELQFELLNEQNKMQIENATLQRIMTHKMAETSWLQVKLAKTIYEQTTLQQKEGITTLTEVLLADNALREAQQNYLTAVIEYLKSDLELKKLTGNISLKK